MDKHGVYPGIVRAVAEQENVPLLDLHRATERVLRQYGDETSRKLFLQLRPGENPNYPNGVEDNTHFNPTGAEIMCKLAVEAVLAAKIELSKYLLNQASLSSSAQ
jgi:lysophospholipase L1-like esterase